MNEIEDYTRRNSEVAAWARETAAKLRAATPRSGSPGNVHLYRNTKVSNTKDGDVITALGFRFPRWGVFAEMGVFGGLTIERARVEGKLRPKPWFNPVVRNQIPKLLEILANDLEDKVEVNLKYLEI